MGNLCQQDRKLLGPYMQVFTALTTFFGTTSFQISTISISAISQLVLGLMWHLVLQT